MRVIAGQCIDWAGRRLRPFLIVLTVSLFLSPRADAVPSMARQTGMACAACHTVFPNLTPFGRQFKLRAYSMRNPNVETGNNPFGKVPISLLLQATQTTTRNTGTAGAIPDNFPKDGDGVIQAAGLYYGGRIAENAGGLVQYFYDGLEAKWVMEMFDVRYANSTSRLGERELIYGFTLSNNPTVTDIYNSTPQWSFPHTETAALAPNARTLVDMRLASQVGGPSAYAMWDGWLYGEFAVYRSARTGLLRPLSWGMEVEDVVRGNAPYWRLALQRERGAHNISLGTYGMIGNIYTDRADFSLGTDRFRDLAVDGQYQYIGDKHIFSAYATWIDERQSLTAANAAGLSDNTSASLRTFRASAHHWFDRRIGGGLQYFSTSGTSDQMRFNTGQPVTGSVTGSPDTRGWIAEVEWLPPIPNLNLKLSVRYTAYLKFNGARSDYDGFGRSASDNNSVFLLAWLLL